MSNLFLPDYSYFSPCLVHVQFHGARAITFLWGEDLGTRLCIERTGGRGCRLVVLLAAKAPYISSISVDVNKGPRRFVDVTKRA